MVETFVVANQGQATLAGEDNRITGAKAVACTQDSDSNATTKMSCNIDVAAEMARLGPFVNNESGSDKNNLLWMRMGKQNACGEKSIDNSSYRVLYKCEGTAADKFDNKFVELVIPATAQAVLKDAVSDGVSVAVYASDPGSANNLFGVAGDATYQSVLQQLITDAEANICTKDAAE